MTEMISKLFFASFRTLPFVFLYGDQEPRSWGGGVQTPPPPAGGGKSRGPVGRGLKRGHYLPKFALKIICEARLVQLIFFNGYLANYRMKT